MMPSPLDPDADETAYRHMKAEIEAALAISLPQGTAQERLARASLWNRMQSGVTGGSDALHDAAWDRLSTELQAQAAAERQAAAPLRPRRARRRRGASEQ